MLTVKKTIKLSAIIRKLNLPFQDFTKTDFNNDESLEKFGFSLIEIVINKLPEVEKELYDFIATYRGIDAKDAQETTIPEIVDIFKEVFADIGGSFKSFLASSPLTSGTTEHCVNPPMEKTT